MDAWSVDSMLSMDTTALHEADFLPCGSVLRRKHFGLVCIKVSHSRSYPCCIPDRAQNHRLEAPLY